MATLNEQLRGSILLEENAMSTAIARPEAVSIVRVQDQGFSRDQIELIKRTICMGATDDELQLFLYVAKKTGLDPFMKQIHPVKRWNKQAGREVMSIQTGIDGYRLIADRTGRLAGISDPAYVDGQGKFPKSATVVVKKLIGNGDIAEFTATARWDEYVQVSKDGTPTSMWASKSYLMLGKCAEALALRKAFPADLSGVYTQEEMMQADNEAAPALPQSSMPIDEYARHAEAIESAETIESLQAAFGKAFVDARDNFKDRTAMDNFTAAYNKRKPEFAK